MKNIIITFLAACLMMVSYDTIAQSYKPIADRNAFITAYQNACKSTQSLECKFKQVKSITLLKDKLESNGNMFFRNDGKLKIEYLKPNAFVFVLNGDKISIKDGAKNANTISVKNNKLFKQICQITLNSINGQIFNSKDFSFEIFENNNTYQIKATPSSKELKAFYKFLSLTINKKTFQTERIEMNEVSGDITTMYFYNILLNQPLKDEIFVVR